MPRNIKSYTILLLAAFLAISSKIHANGVQDSLVFLTPGNLAFYVETESASYTQPSTFAELPDSLSKYEKFTDELSALIEYFENKGFDLAELFSRPEFEVYEGIGDRFRQSVERKSRSLEDYKKILQFEDKKSRMDEFIASHHHHLKKAEEKYGISKYVISAIIAVESDYGTKTGRYNPFNSYVSMYIEDYRSDFARAQLEELLIFTQKNNLDVFELKSSYAGAVSAAQFIPYSLNRWFVGDDIFDMSYNILSVANYLSYFKNITGTIEKAVHRYNPSTLYTQTVMDLANEAEKLFQNTD
ncbi:MAG: lytic murein transglycosylase [Balneolaceae bacterium]